MKDKQLADKAINIKGKDYVLVSDRIIYFNETYPTGMIQTTLISKPDADMVIVKAKVTPDMDKPERYFTGYSQATWGDGMVNKTAALENAETSAVGRALAMLSIGVIDSVASADEMNKAGVRTTKSVEGGTVSEPTQDVNKPSVKQLMLLKKNGIDGSKMSKKEASKTIGDIINGTYKSVISKKEVEDVYEDINPNDLPF